MFKNIFLAVGHSAVNDQNFLVSGRVELGKEMENSSAFGCSNLKQCTYSKENNGTTTAKKADFKSHKTLPWLFLNFAPALKKIMYHQKMLR